jgi:hypothetical protein
VESPIADCHVERSLLGTCKATFRAGAQKNDLHGGATHISNRLAFSPLWAVRRIAKLDYYLIVFESKHPLHILTTRTASIENKNCAENRIKTTSNIQPP